ncbi:hypothetical protein ACJZ2D_006800 [Fusarium nematophilum]
MTCDQETGEETQSPQLRLGMELSEAGYLWPYGLMVLPDGILQLALQALAILCNDILTALSSRLGAAEPYVIGQFTTEPEESQRPETNSFRDGYSLKDLVVSPGLASSWGPGPWTVSRAVFLHSRIGSQGSHPQASIARPSKAAGVAPRASQSPVQIGAPVDPLFLLHSHLPPPTSRLLGSVFRPPVTLPALDLLPPFAPAHRRYAVATPAILVHQGTVR